MIINDTLFAKNHQHLREDTRVLILPTVNSGSDDDEQLVFLRVIGSNFLGSMGKQFEFVASAPTDCANELICEPNSKINRITLATPENVAEAEEQHSAAAADDSSACLAADISIRRVVDSPARKYEGCLYIVRTTYDGLALSQPHTLGGEKTTHLSKCDAFVVRPGHPCQLLLKMSATAAACETITPTPRADNNNKTGLLERFYIFSRPYSSPSGDGETCCLRRRASDEFVHELVHIGDLAPVRRPPLDYNLSVADDTLPQGITETFRVLERSCWPADEEAPKKRLEQSATVAFDPFLGALMCGRVARILRLPGVCEVLVPLVGNNGKYSDNNNLTDLRVQHALKTRFSVELRTVLIQYDRNNNVIGLVSGRPHDGANEFKSSVLLLPYATVRYNNLCSMPGYVSVGIFECPVFAVSVL